MSRDRASVVVNKRGEYEGTSYKSSGQHSRKAKARSLPGFADPSRGDKAQVPQGLPAKLYERLAHMSTLCVWDDVVRRRVP